MRYQGWTAAAKSLDLQKVLDELGTEEAAGAITTFTGMVRATSDVSGLGVVALEVERWEEKADEAMNGIATRIGTKYGLLGVRIVHLYGYLELGDPIVYIAILSAHRKEAFAALEEAIDAYKNESPVWKKEIYENGSSKWITTARH